MASEKFIFIAAVLSAANAAANQNKTWGDVKQCAAIGVLDCHDKCKTKLDVEFQGKMRFCQEDLIHRLFQGFEDCFDKNDLGINNDTAGSFVVLGATAVARWIKCWSDAATHVARLRRQAHGDAQQILAQMSEYNPCFSSCAKSTRTSVDSGCNDGCKPMKNRKNMKAVENCVEEVASKSVADLVVKFFVPCVMDSFGLGDSAGSKLPGALKKSEGTWTMSESARYQASGAPKAFTSSAAYSFSLTVLAISLQAYCGKF